MRGGPWAYWSLFTLCTVCAILPLWAGPVLPLQDYAGNMSYAAILASESGSYLDSVYEKGGLLLPNGLLLWSWAWLGGLIGFVAGGKLLLTLYALALPLSVDSFLRASGRDHRFALMSFPFVYNSSLIMGFASYATSIPVAFFALAAAYRLQANVRWVDVVRLGFWSTLTFLAHAQGYLVLGIMGMAFMMTVPRTLQAFWRTCLGFSASFVVFLPWVWESFIDPPEKTALGGRALKATFQEPIKLFERWAEYCFERWVGTFDDWAFWGVVVIALVGLVDRRLDEQPGRGRAKLSVEWITGFVFLAYLLIPEHTLVQAAIGSRLVVFASLAGLGWLHMPRFIGAKPVLMGCMALLSCSFGLNTASAVERYNEREVGEGLLDLIESLPDETPLAVLIEHGESETVRVHAHEHVYGYHFAFNGGSAYSNFHSYYGRHARWRKGKEMSYPGRDIRTFLRGDTACEYEYMLARTKKIPSYKGLQERLTYIGHAGAYSAWRLEHSRMPRCRKDQEGESDEPRKVVTGPTLKPIASTLSPKVGRARGRDLSGAWKRRMPLNKAAMAKQKALTRKESEESLP